jgi:hypothetical protein
MYLYRKRIKSRAEGGDTGPVRPTRCRYCESLQQQAAIHQERKARSQTNMPQKTKSRVRRRTKRVKRLVRLPSEYFDAIDVGFSLFPALYQFENGLRIAVNEFLKTCYGPDWWNVSLQSRLNGTFLYADNQRKRLDAMPWIGDSSAVVVLPVHLITLGQLEEIVRAYQSDCIPDLFPNIEFFVGHMDLIKRVRNMYSHMFPCITREDCRDAKSEIRVLSRHINALLP